MDTVGLWTLVRFVQWPAPRCGSAGSWPVTSWCCRWPGGCSPRTAKDRFTAAVGRRFAGC